MNDLESKIIAGGKVAFKRYLKMSDGYWLWHAPEYFLTSTTAMHVADKTGHSVFMEASPKKIRADESSRGGRPKNNDKRFDMVVWRKSSDRLRAIIEVKRTQNNVEPLRKDIRKMQGFLSSNKKRVAAYLLVYTEAIDTETKKIDARMMEWSESLDCNLVGKHIKSPDNDRWSWGIGLYRVKAE